MEKPKKITQIKHFIKELNHNKLLKEQAKNTNKGKSAQTKIAGQNGFGFTEEELLVADLKTVAGGSSSVCGSQHKAKS